MKRVMILLCIMSLSVFTQTTDNTAADLEKARARAAAEEQKLAEKEAKAQAAAEAKAKAAAEKEAKAQAAAEAKANKASQTTTGDTSTGYSFWGRNAIGFNFAPMYEVASVRSGIRYMNKKFNIMDGLSIENKKGWSAMGFSYEYRLARFVTLSGDFNFANFGLNASYANIEDLIDVSIPPNDPRIEDIKNRLGSVNLDFKTRAWAVGFRFYTGKKAPYGFFLYPRIGGTIVHFSGNYPTYDGEIISDLAIDDPTKIERHNFSTKTHGIYAAVELGWRIPLFPKLMAKSPVQIAIDISLLDLGYYFKPWSTGILKETDFITSGGLDKYTTFMNIRVVPLPRLGITIKF